MTGAKDPGIGPPKWELYQELLKEDKLTVRLFALWSGAGRLEDSAQVLARVNANPRPPASLGDGMLVSGGVKMFMDGSGGARTAWMYEDWNKNFTGTDTGNAGYPTTPPDVVPADGHALHDAGVHVSTHAIGDRAIDWVVDTYAAVLAAKPTRGLRHGIIHDNMPTDHAIDVMARLQTRVRRRLPRSRRRRSRGGLATTTPATSDRERGAAEAVEDLRAGRASSGAADRTTASRRLRRVTASGRRSRARR